MPYVGPGVVDKPTKPAITRETMNPLSMTVTVETKSAMSTTR